MISIGLQLYSVRDLAEKDLKEALHQVSDLGYEFVEFAGLQGNSASCVTDWMQEYNLTASGTHTGLQALLCDFDGTVAAHRTLGCKDCIIPCAPTQSSKELLELINAVNLLIPRLEENGLRLSYHNHDCEFLPNSEGKIPIFELLEQTAIGLELDTFWAYAAGYDPCELMEKYKDRLVAIHIKDGFANGEGVPLGKGTAPVEAVYRKTLEMGVPMIVESETLTPSGMAEAEECIRYLKTLA